MTMSATFVSSIKVTVLHVVSYVVLGNEFVQCFRTRIPRDSQATRLWTGQGDFERTWETYYGGNGSVLFIYRYGCLYSRVNEHGRTGDWGTGEVLPSTPSTAGLPRFCDSGRGCLIFVR